jgi:hypothetical protein
MLWIICRPPHPAGPARFFLRGFPTWSRRRLAEAETNFYATLEIEPMAAQLTKISRRQTRSGSIIASSTSLRTPGRGVFGPVLRSSTVSRFRHVATILGVTRIPGSTPRSQLAIAALLLGWRVWSRRSPDECGPERFPPFKQMNRTIKTRGQTPERGMGHLRRRGNGLRIRHRRWLFFSLLRQHATMSHKG